MAKSQFNEFEFIMETLGNKKNGFFVEFGAFDGKEFSNTFDLERIGWTGILGEADPQVHNILRSNRPNAKIDTRAVWKKTGETLTFHSCAGGKLSTLDQVYQDAAHPGVYNANRKLYQVQTVTLTDMLDDHDAPYNIDFMSVDVEGVELDVLNGFDFSKYEVGIWSIEHWLHFDEIKEVMETKGYIHHYNEAAWWKNMNRYIESYFLHPSLVTDKMRKNIAAINAKVNDLIPVDPRTLYIGDVPPKNNDPRVARAWNFLKGQGKDSKKP